MTDDTYHDTAPERLKRVRHEIVTAAEAVKRSPADIELVAVSKTFDADAVRPVLAAGQRVFGENRVQEAERKWPELKREFADVELHLIGPLQSNKAKDAVALFDVIHTIDREKIARAVAEEISRQGRALERFVQVNTGEESQKAGVPPREA
ncbi:MAG: alanine racemase, partial [Hyphomicrobium denitrificans]|nr:alanine racemase [Hyphomicrobium denitrificans]